MKATAARATKAIRVSDAATMDMLVGVDTVGYKRCDVSIHRTTGGGLHRGHRSAAQSLGQCPQSPHRPRRQGSAVNGPGKVY
jgi:hypothetical protein